MYIFLSLIKEETEALYADRVRHEWLFTTSSRKEYTVTANIARRPEYNSLQMPSPGFGKLSISSASSLPL